MKILFFDIEIAGHHIEYISHIVKYISLNKKEDSFYFVVHPDFNLRATDLFKSLVNQTNIFFIPITQMEFESVNKKNILINSILIYKLLNKYSKKINPNNVFLLSLNIFIFSLILFKSKFIISGILFAQFTRMTSDTIKDKLKYYRKYWQTKFLAKNKKIKSLFILNDNQTCNFLNEKFNLNKFIMLPDPVPEIEPLKEFSLINEYKIEKQRKIFLHFGSLSERKGSIDILESISFIDHEIQRNICILLAGKPDVNIERTLIEKINYFHKNSNVQIVFDGKFIENRKMKSMFDQCDIVLIPYKNVESSSGILGHAATSGKPVIGTSRGLLGNLISSYNLGYLINDVNPKSLASAISETYNKEFKIFKNEFRIGRSTKDFSEKILNSVLFNEVHDKNLQNS